MNTKQSVALASVSALAAGAAQGAVIYSQPLNLQQNWAEDPNPYRQPVDINGDTLSDFIFGYDVGVQKPYVDARVAEMGQSGLVNLLGKSNQGFPLTAAGTMIDSAYASTYSVIAPDRRGYLFQDDGNVVVGDWPGDATAEGFVGIQLNMSGQTHYGWLHFINRPTDSTPNLTLVDWAYEDTPNTGIETAIVPEPSSLALAGAGMAALLMFRRRE